MEYPDGSWNNDAELTAAYEPPMITVIWEEKDPELRALIAIHDILSRAELPGHAVVRLGDYLSSLGKNKSFARKETRS